MTIEGRYAPSPRDWVREQVAEYEASGGTRANTLRDTGIPIVVVTMRGARTGDVRKVPLMRVAHEGQYALVASYGGAPKHPVWYHNLRSHPQVELQDGAEPVPMTVAEVHGEERETWWRRAVEVFPPYADYRARTDREIPVLVAAPHG